MADPFIAEVKIFAGNFAPRGWAFCDGQLLQIAQNTALFSLIGVIYGGDGRTTFALPNLQGRLPMHAGNGPGLSSRAVGETGGAETATLTEGQLATHSHAARAHPAPGSDDDVVGTIPALVVGASMYTPAPPSLADMAAESLTSVGGGQAHTNLQPTLTLNFIIATIGLFPSRS